MVGASLNNCMDISSGPKWGLKTEPKQRGPTGLIKVESDVLSIALCILLSSFLKKQQH